MPAVKSLNEQIHWVRQNPGGTSPQGTMRLYPPGVSLLMSAAVSVSEEWWR
jgi:hypothetical protein